MGIMLKKPKSIKKMRPHSNGVAPTKKKELKIKKKKRK